MTLRSVEMFTEYEPAGYVSFISPTPLLMVVALGDVLTVADLALAAYAQALEPKKLIALSGGHFDAYVKDFDAASKPAVDWFSLQTFQTPDPELKSAAKQDRLRCSAQR